MIAALYVQKGGVYYGLPDVDPWDEERDARKYAGPWPVVAHPPCARWCQMAGLVQHRYPHLKKGEDGGCFAAALAAVRTWGGVLEHPAYTKAWPAHGLIAPNARTGWQRCLDGGWVCEVAQVAYGHRGRKLTWLYASLPGTPSPADWKRPPAFVSMTWCKNHGGAVQRMGHAERSKTPIPFRDFLLSIARAVLEKRP